MRPPLVSALTSMSRRLRWQFSVTVDIRTYARTHPLGTRTGANPDQLCKHTQCTGFARQRHTPRALVENAPDLVKCRVWLYGLRSEALAQISRAVEHRRGCDTFQSLQQSPFLLAKFHSAHRCRWWHGNATRHIVECKLCMVCTGSHTHTHTPLSHLNGV